VHTQAAVDGLVVGARDNEDENERSDEDSDGDDDISDMMDIDPPAPIDDEYVPLMEPSALETVLVSSRPRRPQRTKKRRRDQIYYEGTDYAPSDYVCSDAD
jgi:hypothetical protein